MGMLGMYSGIVARICAEFSGFVAVSVPFCLRLQKLDPIKESVNPIYADALDSRRLYSQDNPKSTVLSALDPIAKETPESCVTNKQTDRPDKQTNKQ